MKVYIHQPTLSKFGKLPTTVLSLAAQTAQQCVNGFDWQSLEFVILTTFAPESYTKEFHLATKLVSYLGWQNVFTLRSETASSSGASAVHLANYLIRSGQFKTGMVIGVEVMSRLDRQQSNLVLGSVLSDRQQAFNMFMAHGGAMITNRYFYEYGYDRKDLYHIAKKVHDNGLENPKAHLQKEINETAYFQAPMICAPLCLYDISPLSDGAAALIVSSEKPSPIEILATGHGTHSLQSDDLATSFPASTAAYKMAYQQAGITPDQIAVAELHDAFTTFEVIGAEDAGLFARGQGLKYVVDGHTHKQGKLPINPSGGLKSRGHPIGASGVAQIVELANFMQENDKGYGLAHSIGGLATNNFATILKLNKKNA